MTDLNSHKLVLYNDEVTSFPIVIACLMQFCDMVPQQAEQCALIADKVGKCNIKTGDYLEMLELKTQFERLEIITEIENHESYMY